MTGRMTWAAHTVSEGAFEHAVLLTVTEGPVPAILAGLGVSAPALRAAISHRYRRAD